MRDVGRQVETSARRGDKELVLYVQGSKCRNITDKIDGPSTVPSGGFGTSGNKLQWNHHPGRDGVVWGGEVSVLRDRRLCR